MIAHSQEPKPFHQFTSQRLKWPQLPPLDPTKILRSQHKAAFVPASGGDAVHFVFHCSEKDRLDKLYLFYRELAKQRLMLTCCTGAALPIN